MIIRPVASVSELEKAFDVAGMSTEPPIDHTDWRFDAVRDAFPLDQDVNLIAEESGQIIEVVLCFRDEGGVRARLLGIEKTHQGHRI